MMSDTMEYYAPITLATTRTLSISPSEDADEAIEVDINLTWADGMIGVIPMFDSLETAKAYTGDNMEIMMFEGPTLEEAENVEQKITKD